MPVTFTVTAHPANPVHLPEPYRSLSGEDLLEQTWGRKSRTVACKELLQSSITPQAGPVLPRANGFVDTVVEAYNKHHQLILRPDDVWITILSQFNAYVNAHGEELRSLFVAHEGKKELVVTFEHGNRYTVDYGSFAEQMTEKIHQNVVDESLVEWILPNFSTTSHTDTVVSAVMMMATLKSYFTYTCCITCGLPSVTLEGEKSDWEILLARLDKLATFGDEPKMFVSLLRPILTRFVNVFTNAETGASQDLDFWGRICHTYPTGSGPTYLCGWITAFCVWDKEGKWVGPTEQTKEGLRTWAGQVLPPLQLDGIHYSMIDLDEVPVAFCEVDVKLIDNGIEFECMMVSGHVGSLVEGERQDAVRPLPAWFMFIKEEREDPDVVAIRELSKKYNFNF